MWSTALRKLSLCSLYRAQQCEASRTQFRFWSSSNSSVVSSLAWRITNLLLRKRFFASGAGLVVRGWARRATNLLITKKGYKQVMKKISNEIKRM